MATALRPDVTSVTLCLTHDCTLRCRYCYGGAKEPRHLELETGLSALELALAREPERLHVVFFGGEPLARFPTLVALTEAAEAKAAARGALLGLTVTTNGTLLTPERAAWMAERGFLVALSCDGTAEAHDRNRVDGRGRGSHSRTVEGLAAALESGLRVRVVLVVEPGTVGLLAESVAYLVGLGAADFVVNVDWSADWSPPEVRARWGAAYETLSASWADAYRAGRPFWISTVDEKVVTHVRGGYEARQLCDLGRRDLVVAPSGNLYPCDRLVGEDRDPRFVIGHVSTGVDPARLAATLGCSAVLPAPCQGCVVAPRCRNRCFCANLAMTGSPDVPSETLCFHEQLAIRCADAAASALAAEGNALFRSRHLPG